MNYFSLSWTRPVGFIVFALLLSLNAFNQGLHIKGVVKDTVDNKYIHNASIVLQAEVYISYVITLTCQMELLKR